MAELIFEVKFSTSQKDSNIFCHHKGVLQRYFPFMFSISPHRTDVVHCIVSTAKPQNALKSRKPINVKLDFS